MPCKRGCVATGYVRRCGIQNAEIGSPGNMSYFAGKRGLKLGIEVGWAKYGKSRRVIFGIGSRGFKADWYLKFDVSETEDGRG